MTENKKMNIENMIRRPAIAAAIIASAIVALYWIPKTLVFIAAGWFIYLILYQLRGILYRQGYNRIFILGIIALIPTFMACLIAPSGEMPQWQFQIGKYVTNSLYFNEVNGWLAENADKFLFWKYGLAWSLFCGTLLYVLNVELDNPEIKRNDLAGRQINAGDLNRYDDTWETIFNILSVAALALYNLPLAACWFCYLIVSGVITNKTTVLITDAIILMAVLAFSLWRITTQELLLLIRMPHMVTAYVFDRGLWAMVKEAFSQVSWFAGSGMLIVVVLPLAVRTWFDIAARQTVKKLTQQKEQEQKINAAEGVFIGYDTAKKSVIITDEEFNQHCLILGTTGSGKTTTLFSIVDSCLKRGLPLIFLDGKGSRTLADKIGTLAATYNRKIRVFAFDSDRMPFINAYNPFASGNFTEWKNRVMALFQMAEGRGQEHFALEEEMYINMACQILYRKSMETHQEVDLKLLMEFLAKPQDLLDIANGIDPELAHQFASVLGKEGEKKPLQSDIARMLNLFINSTYGHLFNTDRKTEVIRLKESIQKGEAVIFMFNASSYSLDTVKAAKMVIADINSSLTELANTQGFTKCYCIFDEFASYASSNLSETISLQRSHGMHAVIGTQSIATVSLRSPETKRIAEELIACCSTYIIQKIQHQEDVELMAKVMGTKPAYEVTSQIDSRAGESTGRGTVKSVDEFKVNPQKIRELKVGEGYVYRKAAGKTPTKVKFNQII